MTFGLWSRGGFRVWVGGGGGMIMATFLFWNSDYTTSAVKPENGKVSPIVQYYQYIEVAPGGFLGRDDIKNFSTLESLRFEIFYFWKCIICEAFFIEYDIRYHVKNIK